MPRRNKEFLKLKFRMTEQDVEVADLIPIIGKKKTYISERLNAKHPWNTDEIKKIGAYLEIPREEWPEYFGL
jgi:hypothetical protein